MVKKYNNKECPTLCQTCTNNTECQSLKIEINGDHRDLSNSGHCIDGFYDNSTHCIGDINKN